MQFSCKKRPLKILEVAQDVHITWTTLYIYLIAFTKKRYAISDEFGNSKILAMVIAREEYNNSFLSRVPGIISSHLILDIGHYSSQGIKG